MVAELIIADAIKTATKLIGTKEEKPNRGLVIDQIQKELGFLGLPYCVIFCLYCYKLACKTRSLPFPIEITASSQTLFAWAKQRGFTYTDPYAVKPGDIAIWRKWKLWQGHAGLITSSVITDNNYVSMNTIEGNTSNNNFGSQSDGDGIYRRIRGANKIDFDVDGFYLRGFINLKKIFSSNEA